MVAPDAHHLHDVAVGDKLQLLKALGPEVAILNHHQQVAAHQLLLAVQDTASYSLIISISQLIGAAHHNGILNANRIVGVRQLFDEVATRNPLDVGKPIQAKLRLNDLLGFDHRPDGRSILQNTRSLVLANHLSKPHLLDIGVVAELFSVERRTILFANGRQLGAIAKQD